ncbi:uncharacterized protein LOC135269077 [Aotus nancymaae]|uniref:uncharacterized protein LOC135269077 n=1 Tax=Aotus nancymaae TaxID=37293 RepID=UPI0030FE0A92
MPKDPQDSSGLLRRCGGCVSFKAGPAGISRYRQPVCRGAALSVMDFSAESRTLYTQELPVTVGRLPFSGAAGACGQQSADIAPGRPGTPVLMRKRRVTSASAHAGLASHAGALRGSASALGDGSPLPGIFATVPLFQESGSANQAEKSCSGALGMSRAMPKDPQDSSGLLRRCGGCVSFKAGPAGISSWDYNDQPCGLVNHCLSDLEKQRPSMSVPRCWAMAPLSQSKALALSSPGVEHRVFPLCKPHPYCIICSLEVHSLY